MLAIAGIAGSNKYMSAVSDNAALVLLVQAMKQKIPGIYKLNGVPVMNFMSKNQQNT
jgi:hypothetical protein